MKYTKFFYVALIFTMVGAFSGCQSAGQGTTPETQATHSSADVPVPSTSLADEAAYQSAQQLKDPTFCDKIQNNEGYKQQCKTDIVDQVQLQAALEKVDPTACQKISIVDRQDACKIRVEAIQKQKELIVQQQTQNDKEHQLAAGIVEKGDYTQCKQFTISGVFNDCEIDILSVKAVSTKDSSWCDKASSDNNKEQCMAVFGKMTTK